jgi:pyruvate formate-lyase activating enzyme-like uncharacterized protein
LFIKLSRFSLTQPIKRYVFGFLNVNDINVNDKNINNINENDINVNDINIKNNSASR